MQILAQVVSIVIAVVGIALFVRAIRQIIAVVKVGQPSHRTDNPMARTVTLLKETLGHTRMLQWRWVGAGHWFVFVGFGLLFFTLVTAFGQLFDAHFALPLIGHFFLWEWISELFTFVMIIAIVAFIYYRATRPQERARGPKGRFWGSTMWQGYFVEMVILGVGLCIVVLRGLEYALLTKGGEHSDNATALHFPLSFPIGKLFEGMSASSIENAIYLVAMLKIVISFAWMITISLQPTMGVAWHRFLAFFNIFFRRNADGRTALGGLAPMTSGGKVIDFEDLEEMDEDTVLGVGKVEDFAWKGILDFSTCTECGRCQSQCPAWNTEKPLSPKLLITALRDHAYAKAPYVQAPEGEREALLENNTALALEAERPLIGDTGDDWFYNPDSGAAVIDSEVLWNCTSCGACVQQCPVDIEHVDHIMDMRRYQVLIESNFPTELSGLFKGLENKGNPWNMSPNARMDWAKDLPFDVKVVGEDVESLDEVDWLFWVGCAGAYEDRAKKTTRAVAELLDLAGVDFAVLGNGETCTGDPARRAGNEFVFQGLATQNAEVFKETKAKKVVSTCAHCFNTLKNEYAAFGVELEVVHHTQLLNRLVREKKLVPVASNGSTDKRSVTYHDPCYIGRHNGVYSPPRELLNVIPDADLTEMPRNSERSFCCGAGGARMWMEENTGERINVNRTKEAVETGADQIAVGCPFCRVMLSDGLTAQQAKGEAREEVEVLDVAQMLLASIKGDTKPVKKSEAKAGAAAAGAAAATEVDEDATKAEPEAGDETQTEETVTDTEDVGPAAKASGGSSLFDMGDDSDDSEAASASGETETETEAQPEAKTAAAAGGGSLFDLGDDSADSADDSSDDKAAAAQPEAEKEPEAKVAEESSIAGGGSLFDLGGDDDAAEDSSADTSEAASKEEEPEAKAADDASESASEGFSGGSLFDLGDDSSEEPEEKPAAEAKASDTGDDVDRSKDDADTDVAPQADEADASAESAEEAPAAAAASSGVGITPATEIPEGGSLLDIEAPAEEQVSAPVAAAASSSGSDQEPAPETERETETTAEAGGEDAAADSTTDGLTDRSQDDADTDVTPESETEASESDGSETKAPAAAAASSGVGITPATEIPEGGSLFDIAEPVEEQVSTPVAAAATGASANTETTAEAEDSAASGTESEDAAADSTTDGPTDRSQDDADTDVAPDAETEANAAESDEAERAAEDEPVAKADETSTEPETKAPAAAAASSGVGITPATEIPEGGSLFDIAEPVEEQVSTPAAATTDASSDKETTVEEDTEAAGDEPEASEEPAKDAAESESESESGDTGEDAPITSLHDIKAKYSGEGDSGSTDDGAESEPAGEDPAGDSTTDGDTDRSQDDAGTDVAPDEAEQPKPASSGEAHQPKTDTEITEGGSLFDL